LNYLHLDSQYYFTRLKGTARLSLHDLVRLYAQAVPVISRRNQCRQFFGYLLDIRRKIPGYSNCEWLGNLHFEFDPVKYISWNSFRYLLFSILNYSEDFSIASQENQLFLVEETSLSYLAWNAYHSSDIHFLKFLFWFAAFSFFLDWILASYLSAILK